MFGYEHHHRSLLWALRKLIDRLIEALEGRGKPPFSILLSFTKGGTTVRGIIMDITLHVGKREFFQLAGQDDNGAALPLTNAKESEASGDTSIATVTANDTDPTQIAVDGIAAGTTTVTITVTNNDGTTAVLVLNVTVLAPDVTQVTATQIGGEVPAGTPFPGVTPPSA